MQRIFCVLLFLSSFCFALPVRAGIFISEIMYNPEGRDDNREWIELCNDGIDPVDITGWRILENGIKHKINIPKEPYQEYGNFVLGGYECVVVADDPGGFLGDWSDYNGILLDSSFSLKRAGEEIALLDSDFNQVDSVFYSSEWGGDGDGNSLQKIGNSWTAGPPTPGQQNIQQEKTNTNGGPGDQQKDNNISSGFSPDLSYSGPDIHPQIYAYAGEDKTAVAGVAVEFEGVALGLQKEPLKNARYLWSFGDGSIGEGRVVRHIYHYPGEYVVFLNVSSGQYSASDSLIVRVVSADLKISEANDEYIMIQNNSKYDIDISGWYLRSGKDLFRFPETTIIKSRSSVPIPFNITGIRAGKDKKVELLYPNLSIADFYENEGVLNKTQYRQENSIIDQKRNPIDQKIEIEEKTEDKEYKNEISLDTHQEALVEKSLNLNFNFLKNIKPEWVIIVLSVSLISGLILVYSFKSTS